MGSRPYCRGVADDKDKRVPDKDRQANSKAPTASI